MATLPGKSAIVIVGPLLSASGPKLSWAEVTWAKPEQVPSVERFLPRAMKVPEIAQLAPEELMVTIESFICSIASSSLRMVPPVSAKLPEKVLKLIFNLPAFVIAPPTLLALSRSDLAELPVKVLLRIFIIPLVSLTITPPP